MTIFNICYLYNNKLIKMEIVKNNSNGRTKKIYRSYTISSEEDFENLLNGKCPNYALDWGFEYNKSYWKPGHDFITGSKSSFYNKKKKE